MRDEIEKALGKIRPMLQRDGGSVELVDVVGSVVKVRLTGACHGCPMSQMTLKTGIERIIKAGSAGRYRGGCRLTPVTAPVYLICDRVLLSKW